MDVLRIAGDGDGPRPDLHPEPTAGTLPLVLVTWRDAWFDFEHADDEEPRSDYLVSTVGFVVRDSARFVSIAQEVLPDGDGFRAVTHIPISVIETITSLRPDGIAPPGVATDGIYSPDADATSASDLGRGDA